MLAILLFHLGRTVFPFVEEPPAFAVNRPGYMTVFLGEGFPEIGYRHFINGSRVSDVIQMAFTDDAGNLPVYKGIDSCLRSGEALRIVSTDAKVYELERFFVPAGQRMSLGIALHPDTMKVSDWQALPGIGPRLAARIVQDRQKNGDFGEIMAVQRVSGIGPATVKRLRKFF
ncbi:ComEA family DNA-binding protein [Syntrophotalea carbinolica]|uniref:ComEA family DNA-binding protein n=1 Tax=Syntrophotalea carbinolica TaxID=19 RepID=UPI00130E6F6F|nr:helix-hairpin-helix domain-containing protein [Syntrophotalea carbinolica]